MKIHRSILVLLLLVSVIEISLEVAYVGLVLGIRSVAPESEFSLALFLVVLGLQVAVFLLLGYRWLADYWIVRSSEIAHVQGMSKGTESFHPRHIALIEVRQGPFSRLLDYGEVRVSIASSTVVIRMTTVSRPHELAEFLRHTLNVEDDTIPAEKMSKEKENVAAKLSGKGE